MKYAVLFFTIFLIALTGCRSNDDPCNIEAEQQFLIDNAQESGVFETESGLQYRIITEVEDGESPSSNSTVRVDYAGRTIDGDVFDSSFDRGQPADFSLNQVISGFSEGIQLMSVGESYELYIPGNLAYGNNPPPNSGICPGATLIFEVDLIEIL